MKHLLILITILCAFVYSCSENSNEKSISSYKVNKAQMRSLASTEDMTENEMIVHINKSITSITSKDEINPLVENIQSLATQSKHAYKLTLQLYASTSKLIPHFEGIIWRMREVVENSGVIHLSALRLIRKAYYAQYLVGPHIKAAMDYISSPTTQHSKFSTLGAVQNYIQKSIIPALNDSLTSYKEIYERANQDYSFEFDQYLITGIDELNNIKFISDKNRYKTVIKPHLAYILAVNEGVLGLANYSLVYNFDDAPELINYLVKKSAINSSVRNKLGLLPNAITPKDSIEGIRKNRFKSIATTRFSTEDAQKLLDQSLSHFAKAIKYEKIAYENTLEESNFARADQYIVNPKWLDLRKEKTKHRLAEKMRIYEAALNNESIIITSDVTGMQVKLNPRALFTAQTDLKAFLPLQDNFIPGEKGSYVKMASGDHLKNKVTNQKMYAWNYQYGRPNSWPDPTFAGFLPEATNSNLFDILRTLKHTSSTANFTRFLPVP